MASLAQTDHRRADLPAAHLQRWFVILQSGDHIALDDSLAADPAAVTKLAARLAAAAIPAWIFSAECAGGGWTQATFTMLCRITPWQGDHDAALRQAHRLRRLIAEDLITP